MTLTVTQDIAVPHARVSSDIYGPHIEWLTDAAEIERISCAWRGLSERALAPAGSHLEPWLLPTLRHLSPEMPAEVAALWQGQRLTGLVALKAGGWLTRRSWISSLSFLGTPLLDRDWAKPAFAAFLDAVGGRALRLSALPAAGPFWDMLGETLRDTGGSVEVVGQWERAVLRPQGTFEEWFSGNFDRKRRKEYRRLRNRLGEEGAVESRSWAKGDPVEPWVDELIELEAKGWKGRRGTALAAQTGMEKAFREAIERLADDATLRFWKITFNGKPIAMMSGMVSGDQGWLGKIAYDESFARYSPGVLLILDATESLFGERLALVDSCAIPNHPMISNIWRERIALCDVMVRTPRLSPALFRLALAAEKARGGARATAKSLFHQLTGRKTS